MTTDTAHSEHHTHKPLYIRIFVLLMILLVATVGAAWIQLPGSANLIVALTIAVIKAALIIAYFMHLKFERFSLFLTLFPMLIFCILMMLVFMPDSMRLTIMRTQ